MKRELERIEIQGEHEARQRAGSIVLAAFLARQPTPRGRSWKPVAVLVLLLAFVAGLLSPPGRAVLDEVRDAVGVEQAQPALFSLPTGGRLLVTSTAGAWIVDADGSKRLLGDFDEASWSPYGRFVVATRRQELAALEDGGDIRWTLARPELGRAAWGGTRTDTRVAYTSRDELRAVGGDGRGDRFLGSAPDVPEAPFAWVPGSPRLLAHATQGILRLLDVAARGAEVWSARVEQPFALAWTSDGERLVAISRGSLTVFDARGRRVFQHQLAGRASAASVSPQRHVVAVSLRLRGIGRSEVIAFSLDRQGAPQRRFFGGTGAFDDLVWSPDGRWLAIGWVEADQLVFIRVAGRQQIRAISNISQQLRSSTFPRIEGWCCAG